MRFDGFRVLYTRVSVHAAFVGEEKRGRPMAAGGKAAIFRKPTIGGFIAARRYRRHRRRCRKFVPRIAIKKKTKKKIGTISSHSRLPADIELCVTHRSVFRKKFLVGGSCIF